MISTINFLKAILPYLVICLQVFILKNNKKLNREMNLMFNLIWYSLKIKK
jgi:EamA domain-containing membrane protein RarD